MNSTGKHHRLPPTILRRRSSSTALNFRRQEESSSHHERPVLNTSHALKGGATTPLEAEQPRPWRPNYFVDQTTASRKSHQNGSAIEENQESKNPAKSNSPHPCERDATNSQPSIEISSQRSISDTATSGKNPMDAALPTCLHVQTDRGLSVRDKFAARFLMKERVSCEDIRRRASCLSTTAPESVTTLPGLHSNDSMLSSPEVTSTEISHSTPVFHIIQPQFYLNVKQTKDGECDFDIRNIDVDIPISDVPPTLQPFSTADEHQPETTGSSMLNLKAVRVSDLPLLQNSANDESSKITQSEEACVNLSEPAEIAAERNNDETVSSTQPEENSNVFVQPQIIGVFSLRNTPEKNDTSPQYQCPKCLKRFHRILSQLEHKCNPKTSSIGSLHKLRSVKLYKCLECLEEFSDVEKKKSHACSSQVHQAKTKNSDQASSVDGKKSLQKAAKMWCRTSRGSFQCNICKKRSLKESKMQAHCVRKHGDRARRIAGNKAKETTSQNKTKKKKFGSSSNQFSAEGHTDTQKHRFEQPFKCGLCSMKYKRVAFLKKHIALHMGPEQFKRSKRPFVCRLCKSRFHDSSTLKVHSGKKCIQTIKKDAKQNDQDKSSSSGIEVTALHVREPNTCLGSKAAAVNTTSEDSSSSLPNEKHFPKRKHRCGFCGILCESSTCLKKHVRSHWNQVFESYSRPLECCLCNEHFDNCVRFFLHVRRNSCSSTTTDDTSQSSAVEVSDEEARGKMECATATRSNSSTRQEERPHLSGMHQCQFCSLNFWSRDILDIHIHSSHPLLLQTEESATSNSSDGDADRDLSKNKDQGTPDPVISKRKSKSKSRNGSQTLWTDHMSSLNSSNSETDGDSNNKNKYQETRVFLDQQSKANANDDLSHSCTLKSYLVSALKASGIQDQSPPTVKSARGVCESIDLANHAVIKNDTEEDEDTGTSKRTQIYPSQCKICKITLSSWKSLDSHRRSHHAEQLNKHLHPGQSQDCSMESSDDTKIDVVKVNLFNTCELCERVFKYWNRLVFHRKLKHGVHVNCATLSSRRPTSKDKGILIDEPSLEVNDSIVDENTSSSTIEIGCESTKIMSPTQTLAAYCLDKNNFTDVQNEKILSRQDNQNSNRTSVADDNLVSVQNEDVPCRQEYMTCDQTQSQPSRKEHVVEGTRRTVEDLQITQVVSLKPGVPSNLWNSVNCASVEKGNPQHNTDRTMEPLFDEESSNNQVRTQIPESTQPNEITAPNLPSHSSFNNQQYCKPSESAATVYAQQQAILDEFNFLMSSVVTLQSTLNIEDNISRPSDHYEFDGTVKKLPFREVERILRSLERNCSTNAYHCSVCGDILEDIPLYTSHILSHCEFDQYICVFCGQRSMDIFSVLNHVVLTHRKDNVHVPQDPEGNATETVNTSSLTSTSDVDNTAAGKPSTSASPQTSQIPNKHCTYPRPRYDFIFKPKEHENNITLDENTGQYKCPLCKFQYLDRADVIYHIRMYHNGQPYICKHCPEKLHFFPDVQAHFFKNHYLQVTQEEHHAESENPTLGGQSLQLERETTTMQPNFPNVDGAGSCQSLQLERETTTMQPNFPSVDGAGLCQSLQLVGETTTVQPNFPNVDGAGSCQSLQLERETTTMQPNFPSVDGAGLCQSLQLVGETTTMQPNFPSVDDADSCHSLQLERETTTMQSSFPSVDDADLCHSLQLERETTTMQQNIQNVDDADSCHTDGCRKQKSCDESNTDCCRGVDPSPASTQHTHTEINTDNAHANSGDAERIRTQELQESTQAHMETNANANTNSRDDERIQTQELQESIQDASLKKVVVKLEKLSDDVIDEHTYRNLHNHLKGGIKIKTEKLDDGYSTAECMQESDIGGGIRHQSEIEQHGEIDFENGDPTRIVPKEECDIPNAAASCLLSRARVSQSELQIPQEKVKVEKDVAAASQWGLQKEVCKEVELSDANKSDSNDAGLSSFLRSETTTEISTGMNALESNENLGGDSHVDSMNLSDVGDKLTEVEDILQIVNEVGITLTESLPELHSTCCQKINPGDVTGSNRMINQSETSGSEQIARPQSRPSSGKLVQENYKRLLPDGCRELASPYPKRAETPLDLNNPLDTINLNPFHQNETISDILQDIAKNSFTSRILASLQEDSRTSGPASGERSNRAPTALGTKRQLEPLNIPRRRYGKQMRASDDNPENLQAAVAEDSSQVRGRTNRYEVALEDANEINSSIDDFNKIGAKDSNTSQQNVTNHQSLASVPAPKNSRRGVARSSESRVSTYQSNHQSCTSNQEAARMSKKNYQPASNAPVYKRQQSEQQLNTAGNVWPTNKQTSKRRRHCSDGPPFYRYHQVGRPSSGYPPRHSNQSIDHNSNMTVTRRQSQDIPTYSGTLYSASVNVMESQHRSNPSNVALPQQRSQVQMASYCYQHSHHSPNTYQQNSSRYLEIQTQTSRNESQVRGQFAAPPLRQPDSGSATLRELLNTPQSSNYPVNGNNPRSSADRLPDQSNYHTNSNSGAFNNYSGPRDLCSNNVDRNEQSYLDAYGRNLSSNNVSRNEQTYSDMYRGTVLQSELAPNAIPNLTISDYLRPVATCAQPVESVAWDIPSSVHPPSYPQPLHRNSQPMVSPREADPDQREYVHRNSQPMVSPGDMDQREYVPRNSQPMVSPREADRREYVHRNSQPMVSHGDMDQREYVPRNSQPMVSPREADRREYVHRNSQPMVSPGDMDQREYVPRNSQPMVSPREADRRKYVQRNSQPMVSPGDMDQRRYGQRNSQPMVSPRDTDQRECVQRNSQPMISPGATDQSLPQIVSVLSLHPDYILM
ncbi:uncharacterized protein LOC117288825 [Asterias rubens]|uniref:uncharacterized protein LOC117288825 n=1 Tax=Asterias rubens TaxID=7604 RepID=UPI001454F3F8|nr:uncharacterized protein LOC117288825 [Asterias rubens]